MVSYFGYEFVTSFKREGEIMRRVHPTTTKVFDFIKRYNQQYGRPPTGREIAAGLNRSPSTIDRHLNKLEDMGLIEREPRTARGIRIIEP